MVLGRSHSFPGRSVLSGNGMRRLASIFSALMLVLMLWSGTTAHAAERLVGDGILEGDILPIAESVAIMGALDDIRAQIGVRYPGEGAFNG